jgi:hypothetical protein
MNGSKTVKRPVKLSEGVIRTASILAAAQGKNLAEYLSDLLQPILDETYRRWVETAAKEASR